MLFLSLYTMLALNTTNFDSLFLFSFRSNYFLISCVTFLTLRVFKIPFCY